MFLALKILHVLLCLFLIVVVLLQHGKGQDIGAAFGGSSQTVFGPGGGGSFFGKLTAGVAVLFMVTSVSLGYFSGARSVKTLVPESAAPAESQAAAPAGPEGGAPGGEEAVPAEPPAMPELPGAEAVEGAKPAEAPLAPAPPAPPGPGPREEATGPSVPPAPAAVDPETPAAAGDASGTDPR